ncbi:penicillin-binding protein 1C [Trinickia symbiotica]|uniref:penicillin-binding protein 1C n=1 Tax=Trinickia symbiotica TaxID=863227 RepID=UPI000376BFAC|nr:penicillin-binding protein 1C [Trinickia symbiotica]
MQEDGGAPLPASRTAGANRREQACRWPQSALARALGRRSAQVVAGLAFLLIGVAIVADHLYPLPAPGRSAPFALVVTARDGTPLRAFPDKLYIWRNPVTLEDVSPRYVEALIGYEDRAFWWHPGVNPFSLLRAAGQWLIHGRIVSGGSTISMQVARIIDPTPRTLVGKLHQILRALQLEAHFSKREILTLYLNYSPMGGVLEGVDAASRAYLGKPARNLSYAEAAMLAVLPQAPSLLRPDRFARRAQDARDKVLRRMADRWPAAVIHDALTEPVYAQAIREPMLAPLLAERLKRSARGKLRVTSTVDADLQSTVESVLLDRVRTLPRHVSCAALVLDNATLEVRAYVGSADFSDLERASYVDMVRAWRSPGSTLKPFLYGFALDAGLIDSESLLSDVPQSFGGYQPGNFEQSFHGAVSVSEALTRSLNVPAVQVLDQYGPQRFVGKLRQGGLKLRFPRGAEPNLSVILGGADTTLENLVGAYAAFARGGLAGVPRLTSDAPIEEHRMMSAGAAFIVRDILETGGPLGRAVEERGANRGIAWKTGTSFGFRDAWSVGVTDRYTVGVWIGRPDGTPNPGYVGANAATPLMMSIFSALLDAVQTPRRTPPPGVTQAQVCWPMGLAADAQPADLCAVQRRAWLLDGVAPPTFPDPVRGGEPVLRYTIDSVTGRRATADCTTHTLRDAESPLWPTLLGPWLDERSRRFDAPPWETGCAPPGRGEGRLAIAGASSGEVVRRVYGGAPPLLHLSVTGAQGDIGWLMNGAMVGRAAAGRGWTFEFTRPGAYAITAFDQKGRYDRVTVEVR